MAFLTAKRNWWWESTPCSRTKSMPAGNMFRSFMYRPAAARSALFPYPASPTTDTSRRSLRVLMMRNMSTSRPSKSGGGEGSMLASMLALLCSLERC